MPIPFTCPHCGLQTNVLEEYAGQSGPCAKCGRTVTVPRVGESPNYGPPTKRSAAPTVIIIVVLILFVLLFLTCVGFFVAMPIMAVPSAREAARRAQCSNNLTQIGLAMHSYHAAHGCFPPAYVADEKGRPKHSWRVLLLPFLDGEAQALHEERLVVLDLVRLHVLEVRGLDDHVLQFGFECVHVLLRACSSPRATLSSGGQDN